ncbi:MAG: cytochrome c oxidase subunit II [Sphingomonadaceae bacterium]|nr:cytochrome c oxidase subunit II [Sphingomonadaceae bacterium]
MKKLRSALIAIGLVLAPAAAMAQATPVAPAPAAAAPAPVAAAPAVEADAAAAPAAEQAKPEAPAALAPVAGIGQPAPGKIGIQPQVTENGERARHLHDVILLPIITVISLFVLGLLLWVMVRYRRAANPVASKTSHNTVIEVIWTLVPVLILVAVAIPSISLLAAQYKPAGKDAVTIKVIGHQWYWSYQYPDHGDFEIVSNMLTDAEAAKRSEPRLLAVDNRLVVPVGTEIKAIVTSEDVIHSFAVPAFWTKMDAVPGRLNEVTFKVEKEGVYYGQCSELCGARHAFMPIAVEVVSKENFARWVASKGGKMPGAEPVAAPAPAATPAVAPAAAPAAAEGANETAPAAPAAATKA